MANTIIIYQGDGSTTDFAVPFDYLRKSFVRVILDSTTELKGGSSTDTSVDYYFVDATTIRLRKIVPTTTQTITIRRYTSVQERVASFRDGSVLYAKDLDTSQVQAFHIAEEARDVINDALIVDRENNWDAKNKRIVNVAEPIDSSDAATRGYVDKVAGVQKELTKVEATTKQYRDEAEGFRNESLKSATEAKASAGTSVSAMEVAVVKSNEVSVKHTEVISKADQVAKDASEVSANTAKVAQDAQQVSEDKTTVETAKTYVVPIINSVDKIVTVADNIEHVVVDSKNINIINVVGTDLEGSLQDSSYDDYGTIGDDKPLPAITGGNIKVVADNIDAVKIVAGLAPDFEIAIGAVQTVTALTTRAETAATNAESSEKTASNASSVAVSSSTEATRQATLAKGYADSALEDANSASDSATKAQTSATNSANSAKTSGEQAVIATTKASEAKVDADKAAIAKTDAEAARDLAKQYAERVKQVDWNQTDATQVDYIKNKPDVATKDYVDKAYDDYGALS